MGMSVDIIVYDRNKLEEMIKTKFKNNELILKSLPEFGILTEHNFTIQGCDHWEDCNPRWEFERFIECIEQRTDVYELLKEARVDERGCGAEANDVYYDLTGKDLPNHPDEEE